MSTDNFIIEEDELLCAQKECNAIKNDKVRARAVANVILSNIASKFFTDNKYEIDTKSGLHNISSILENIDISDIYINKNYIDVRTSLTESDLCVPAEHFSNNLLPIAYMFIKINEDLSGATVLGFITPDSIKTNGALNDNYYCIDESELQSFYDIEPLLETLDDDEVADSDLYNLIENRAEKPNEIYKKLLYSCSSREKLIQLAKAKQVFQFISINTQTTKKDIDSQENYNNTRESDFKLNNSIDNNIDENKDNDDIGNLNINKEYIDLNSNSNELNEDIDNSNEISFNNELEESNVNDEFNLDDEFIEINDNSDELQEDIIDNNELSFNDELNENSEDNIIDEFSLDNESIKINSDSEELNEVINDNNELSFDNELKDNNEDNIIDEFSLDNESIEINSDSEKLNEVINDNNELSFDNELKDNNEDNIIDELKKDNESIEINSDSNELNEEIIDDNELTFNDKSDKNKDTYIIDELNLDNESIDINSDSEELNEVINNDNSIPTDENNKNTNNSDKITKYKYTTAATPSIDIEENVEKDIIENNNDSIDTLFSQEKSSDENNNDTKIDQNNNDDNLNEDIIIKPKKKSPLTVILALLVISSLGYFGYSKYITSQNSSEKAIKADVWGNKTNINTKTKMKDVNVDAMPIETIETAKVQNILNEHESSEIPLIEQNLDASILVSNLKINWEVPAGYASNVSAKRYLVKLGKIIQLNLKTELLLLNKPPMTNKIAVEIKYQQNLGKFLATNITISSGDESIDKLILKTVNTALEINLNMNVDSFSKLQGNPVLIINL